MHTFRFHNSALVTTHAFLSLDEDVTLTTEEINFAFEVWKTFPERIVGFPARSHFWDERRRLWSYTSARANEYSMILTNAAFLHRKYAKLFVENLSVSVTTALQTYTDCEHILMNFLVALVSKKPPIKVRLKCHCPRN